MELARRITVLIKYNGTDISQDISMYLKDLSYTDNLSGSADDIQIKLEDRAHLWEAEWMPEKGAILDVTLVSQSWNSPYEGLIELRLGAFEIDEIEITGIPSEVIIKAVSVPDNTTLRGVERNRSWEKAEMKTIAQDVAKEAKLELFYDAKENPVIDRAEQTEQSDLSFLQKLCSDQGFALKITDKQIVIFDEEKYEANAAILVISRTRNGITNYMSELPRKTDLISYRFRSAIREVYKACKVVYQSGSEKNKIEFTYTDPNKKNGKTLVVNQQVNSIADAEHLAKKELRNKNKDEISGSLSVMGSFSYAAGITIFVEGFGSFDSKYIITRVKHSIGSGYQCSLDIRKCLDGY